MKKLTFLIISFIVFFISLGIEATLPQTAEGTTWYVDDDGTAPGSGIPSDPFPTIQQGITAASAGDTVQVARGRYNENITMKSGVEVLGAGQNVTTIDGGGSGSVVTADGVDSATKLDGFTITNGTGTPELAGGGITHYYGGGIYCSNAFATISNCTIKNNSLRTTLGVTRGGGMYIWYGSPQVINCAFANNKSGRGSGGGMYIHGSTTTVTHCIFSINSASSSGGGDSGGGICTNYFGGEVIDCIFSGNSAGAGGGGMYLGCSSVNATPKVISCIFNGNSADLGGGMSTLVYYAHLTVANCIFANNSATVFGGGIVGSGNMDITNCTFSGNSALSGGGAIYTNHDSTRVTNCILWGDTPNEIYWIGGAPIVNHSDVRGGWGGGTGNKDVNPLFVDAANGDFHLQPLSQCIDSGDNAAPSLPDSDFEGHLRKYPSGGTVDMGADEYVPLPSDVWVDDDWVGTIPGTDVDGHLFGYDAFDHIQTGINLVALSGTVHVAEGTYTENIDFKGKDITVKSENGAALTTIDGGAAGTVVTFDDGETSGAVLDGFTITNGNGFTGGGIYCSNSSPTIINNIITENHALIVGGGIFVGHITNPFIKGCTITENSAGNQGGGIGCYAATLTLRNVTISGNSAQWGGGIFARNSSALTLDNCIITFSTDGEAFFYNDPGSSATLTCCDVYGNSGGDYVGSIAGQNGINDNISHDPLFCDAAGGDYSLHSNSPCATDNNPCGQIGSEPAGCDPTTYYVNCDRSGDFEWIQTALDEVPSGSIIQLEECVYGDPGNRDLDFKGKAVTLRGLINNPEDCQIDIDCQGSPTCQRRGFYFHSNEGADTVVEGILIKNGYADVGGGILCENSSPTLNNVYFSRNQATDDGGGLACVDHASPTLSGCLFDYCEAGDDGGGLYAYDWSSPMLNDCIFGWNKAADRGGGALFVVNSFPELTGCVFYGNTGMNGGGACFVYAEGPMTDCLFYDNTATFGGGLQCYGNAQCTLTRCTFLGNAASSGGGVYCRNNSSPSLHNTIIAFSTQGQAVARQANDCNPTLACSNLYDNAGGDWVGCIAGQAGTNGNISKNPLFCNVTYKDFTLHEDSPCAQASCGLMGALPVGCGPSLVIVEPGGDITIEDAIGDVADGGTIELTDGRFTGPGNKNIDFQGKAITVRSQSGNPESCIIDCEDDGRGFHFHNGEGQDAVVSGFTITNGYGYDGGAIRCTDSSSPSIINCIILGNESTDDGGAVYCHTASPIFINCIISSNETLDDGGGVYLYNSSPSFINCSIAYNSADSSGGGVNVTGSSSPELTNCILWGNTPDQIAGASATVTYSDVQGGFAGAGNINQDPLLAAPNRGDYHLRSGSACIDAGNNTAVPGWLTLDFEGDDRIIDGDSVPGAIVDMGADEYIDTDGDGVQDSEEMGPNGNDPDYDGNGDGTPDSEQDNVASMHTYDEENYITLASPEETAMRDVRAVERDDAPAEANYPHGFFGFEVHGLSAPRDCTEVTLFLPLNPDINTYWKYGRTHSDPTDHWYKFSYDHQTGAEIFHEPPRTRIVLHLCDNLRGDDDLDANGVIEDIGGPAITAVTCDGDFGQDGDVDGSDLAIFAAGGTGITLEEFATDFGRTNCPVYE